MTPSQSSSEDIIKLANGFWHLIGWLNILYYNQQNWLEEGIWAPALHFRNKTDQLLLQLLEEIASN